MPFRRWSRRGTAADRDRRHAHGRRDHVVLEVTDSGPGIDPEHAAQLFDAFFTTKPDGMGMGLSICRSIIEAHGGQIERWSRAPEPGAIFRCILPIGHGISPLDGILPGAASSPVRPPA